MLGWPAIKTGRSGLFTPLKLNMEPENQPLEKEIPIGFTIIFRFHVKDLGGYLFLSVQSNDWFHFSTSVLIGVTSPFHCAIGMKLSFKGGPNLLSADGLVSVYPISGSISIYLLSLSLEVVEQPFFCQKLLGWTFWDDDKTLKHGGWESRKPTKRTRKKGVSPGGTSRECKSCFFWRSFGATQQSLGFFGHGSIFSQVSPVTWTYLPLIFPIREGTC